MKNNSEVTGAIKNFPDLFSFYIYWHSRTFTLSEIFKLQLDIVTNKAPYIYVRRKKSQSPISQ